MCIYNAYLPFNDSLDFCNSLNLMNYKILLLKASDAHLHVHSPAAIESR